MTTGPYRLLGRDERVRYWRSYADRAVPALVTVALVAATTVPLFVNGPAIPDLALLGVLVWTSFQPGLMPPWLAFIIGGIADLLLGLPLGIHATLLPAMVVFVRLVETRFADHRYGFDWLFAALVVGLFAVAEWLLLAVAGTRGPLGPLLVLATTTILAYPAIVALFARIQRRLLV